MQGKEGLRWANNPTFKNILFKKLQTNSHTPINSSNRHRDVHEQTRTCGFDAQFTENMKDDSQSRKEAINLMTDPISSKES